MKKNLTILMAAAISAIAFSACSQQAPSENAPSAAAPAGQAETSVDEASASEETTESDMQADAGSSEEATAEAAEGESSAAADSKPLDTQKVETKILNKTGKTIKDIKIASEGTSIGLGSVDDTKSTSRKIDADIKEAKIQFFVDDNAVELPLQDGFQGFKIVIDPDGKDGYKLDYVGIDEAD